MIIFAFSNNVFFFTSGTSYLIPLICSIMGIIGLVAIVIMIICHNRRRRKRNAQQRHKQLSIEQKSNNENEENLRRYRNPLFETDKGGGTVKSTSTELIEIDLEKYEKSPRRSLGNKSPGNPSSANDSKQNTPQLKTPKKKDINIEISRTLMSDREVIV